MAESSKKNIADVQDLTYEFLSNGDRRQQKHETTADSQGGTDQTLVSEEDQRAEFIDIIRPPFATGNPRFAKGQLVDLLARMSKTESIMVQAHARNPFVSGYCWRWRVPRRLATDA